MPAAGSRPVVTKIGGSSSRGCYLQSGGVGAGNFFGERIGVSGVVGDSNPNEEVDGDGILAARGSLIHTVVHGSGGKKHVGEPLRSEKVLPFSHGKEDLVAADRTESVTFNDDCDHLEGVRSSHGDLLEGMKILVIQMLMKVLLLDRVREEVYFI